MVILDQAEISKLSPTAGCPEKNSGNSDSGKAAPTAESSAKWTTSVKTEVKAQETAHHRGRCQTKDRLLNQQTGAEPLSRITCTSFYLAGCFCGPGNFRTPVSVRMYTLCSLKCMTPSFKKRKKLGGEGGKERSSALPFCCILSITNILIFLNIHSPIMPEIGLMVHLLNSSNK